MSAEGGPIGAPGVGAVGLATASPSVGAELGASGTSFDATPTFSGLNRSEFHNPTANLSIFNPGETRPFIASPMGVPEGPVKGDIFNSTEIIASNPSLNLGLVSQSEPVSIFDNTSSFQTVMPVSEGPPPFSFKDTFVIAKAGEPATDQMLDQPDINAQDALESYLEVSEPRLAEATSETVTQAVDDMKINDPLTYAQLKSDLKSVDAILNLVDQVEADARTVEDISNQAIETAIQRSGLIEHVEAKIDSAPEEKSGESYVWDEEANAAREEDAVQAIEIAFEADTDPKTGKVNGADVVAAMSPTPSDKEKSKLAKEEGVDGDGSYDGVIESLEHVVFDTNEEARIAAKEAILKNPGVERGKKGPKASENQKTKVLRGGKPQGKDRHIAA